MAYLLEDDLHITEDILRRKEYNQYDLPHIHEHDDNIIPKFFIDKMLNDNNYLQFHSYQLFVSNYINPNTPYSRLLMKWQTGTGKSIGALSIALNFIKYFQMEALQGVTNIGSVFIMGFTSHIFRNELLRYPEFGIVTREDIIKMNNLKKLAYAGNKFDVEKLQEFLMKIKKRFNNRENNGFFQFIGYKKIVNMIFIVNDPKINITNLDENEIDQAVKSGKIGLNQSLLEEFKNSLIICDEIHNVYNSLDKNNWGVALQYILNHHPSIRAVFMSATPINNSPTEIVDLLNLLLPSTYYSKLEKGEFFDNEKKLKPGALDKIANLCKGRVSYLSETNPKYYPTKQFIGEAIDGAPYLKFIRCPMSDFHYNTYKSVYTGTLSPEGQYLTDFAIPNPNDSKVGLYQTGDIKKFLPYASQEWKDANKINFKKEMIIGDILRIENLSKISNKYVKMMEVVNDIIKNQKGKIFIYHNVIHMSGVLFIQEIMLQNYIIGEHDASVENTLCAICGKMRKEHKSKDGGADYEKETKESLQTTPHKTVYNEVLGVYAIMRNETQLLEYHLIDEIIVIQCRFINYTSDIISVIEELSEKNKVIIVYQDKCQHESCDKIIAELKYKALSNKDYKTKYFASSDFLDDDIKSLIKRIEKVINPKKLKGRNPKKIRGGATEHTYMPVRFIAVHSDMDRSLMNNSLDKFNAPDNSDGARIMILIGGKLIKEAFDIKAIRELLVMGRPDNIPTLIQIIGRAVRKGSHKFLPQEKRNVNIRIFTSAVPEKKNGKYILGYEEEKYVEKLQHYKIIQNIEKTMHENAIDAFINKDIIFSADDRKAYKSNKKQAELGSLYFEPNLSKNNNRVFKLNELNLQTFNAFHSNNEIDDIMAIIKRLFIEWSPVWTYVDLFDTVKNARKWMQVEFNTELINENLFITAFSRLVWAKDANYVEPNIKNNLADLNNQQSIVNNIIDKIYDSDDKIIILPGNQKSIISQVGIYYILFPLDELNNEPIKINETPYRINKTKEPATIYIRSFLESGHSITRYSDKRNRFYNKWNNVDVGDLEMAVCDFGTDFHILFLEECIKYIFDVWTDTKLKKSFMHTFYFKMINYYDLRKLVIWGHTLKPNIYKKYDKFLRQVSVKIKNDNRKELKDIAIKEQDISSSGLINLLKSSINKSDVNWISSGMKHKYEHNLNESLKLFDGNYKKQKTSNQKIDADLVPVGHFLNYIPRFYTPSDGWFESPEYLDPGQVFVENNTVIGYDERSKTGVHIRFKIRSPIQNIKQFKDSRLIEKGSVCSSKSKVYLKDISQKLGIKIKGKINVFKLCSDIRTQLIYLELKERIAKTNKKWFYFIYERRPETNIEQ